MRNRHITYAALGALALILAAGSAARADEPTQPDCHLNVNTDKGSGGWHIQQCDNSVGVGFSGPIKDVDTSAVGVSGMPDHSMPIPLAICFPLQPHHCLNLVQLIGR